MSKSEPSTTTQKPVCPACEGSGIVIEKNTDLQIEVGRFCRECDEGERRWRRIVRLFTEGDEAAGNGTLI
jgi:DnaJ-class molecular chaperone